MPLLAQWINVPTVLGGTGACAWSVTKALHRWQHVVIVPPNTTPAQLRTLERQFCPAHVARRPSPGLQPDLALLHNRTNAVPILACPTIQYHHSQGRRAPADLHVYCSQWLATQCGQPHARILYQGVPTAHGAPNRYPTLTIGRLCTPTARKWPPELVPFYRHLAREFPQIRWEFVGAPGNLAADLATAIGPDRTTFHRPSDRARQHLRRWHALLYHNPNVTESFGRVCAEAMLCGCIPIVDNRGGFKEQINHTNGFLCDTAAEFAHAITQLTGTETREHLAARAQLHAQHRFSHTALRTRLLNLWDSLRK